MTDVNKIIALPLDAYLIQKAKERAAEMPPLKNSILNGKGVLAGKVGEIYNHLIYGGDDSKNCWDFDFIDDDGKKNEVKTRQTEKYAACHHHMGVAGSNSTQKCDRYSFAMINWGLGLVFVLGHLSEKQFYNKARFYKKGAKDELGYFSKCDEYKLLVSELIAPPTHNIKKARAELAARAYFLTGRGL